MKTNTKTKNTASSGDLGDSSKYTNEQLGQTRNHVNMVAERQAEMAEALRSTKDKFEADDKDTLEKTAEEFEPITKLMKEVLGEKVEKLGTFELAAPARCSACHHHESWEPLSRAAVLVLKPYSICCLESCSTKKVSCVCDRRQHRFSKL